MPSIQEHLLPRGVLKEERSYNTTQTTNPCGVYSLLMLSTMKRVVKSLSLK